MANPGSFPAYNAGKARREKFLASFRQDQNIDLACLAAEVSVHAYRSWRKKYPDFASQIDAIRAREMDVDPDAKTARGGWPHGFASFRKTFFGMDSPWFHLDVVRVLDEVGGPGEIVLILLPPEHGKTTLLEDYINYKLATDPGFRITFGSEKQDHSRKVGGRVKNRMEPDGSARTYESRFGPFAPQKGSKRRSVQPWGTDYWSIYKKKDTDERDYSFVALGMGSSIIGTRTDLLVVDDPQSRKTLGQTETLVEVFRQDWLSRPGTKGRTVIIGSRVGVGDFYEALMDEDLIDHLICYPAINDEGEWLWPERYSPEEYKLMRRNAGQDGWERNYLMRPTAKGDASFAEDTLDSCKDEYRSVIHVRADHKDWPSTAIIGWDPGYGTNAIHVAAFDEKRFWPIHQRTDHKATSPQELFGFLEEEIIRTEESGFKVVEVVVEDKAFQHGLLDDERMHELVRRYGFRVSGHQTGGEKNDEDIGVPGMVLSMLRKEITFPWADTPSQHNMEPLLGELKAWRPRIRGTKLRQDRVMAMWFAWLRWRRRRSALLAEAGRGPTTPKKRSLPWRPTRAPLLTRSR